MPGVLQAPAALRGGRAAAVALVAKQMAEAGKAVLPEALLPDYHRLSQAERERAERLQQKLQPMPPKTRSRHKTLRD